MPWLPGPDVGHPGWLPYLTARAQLIADRAQELGSLPAAYREQYAVTDPGPTGLGAEPEPDTRRAVAYRIAAAHLPPTPDPVTTTRQPRSLGPPAPAPALPRSPMSQQAGRHLSR